MPAALFAYTAACSSGEDEPRTALRIELPVRAEHRAALVAVEAENSARGRETSLHALSIAEGTGIEMPFIGPIDEADELVLTALLYDRPLEELYLEAGEVPLIQPGLAARAVPDPDTIERAQFVSGDTSAEFLRLTEIPTAVADLRISSPFTCGDFEVREIPLGTTRSVRFLLTVGTGVLVSASNAERYFVRPDGAIPLISPPVEFYEAFVAEDGAIWLGAEDGEVWRGTLAPHGCESSNVPCERLDAVVRARVGVRTEILSLDGPRTANPDELYVLSYDGELVRLDFINDQQRLIYDFADEPHTVRRIGAVAWLKSNEVVAVFDNERAPIRFIDDTVRTEPFALLQDELNRVIHIPGFGSVIGSFCGRIFRNISGQVGGWELVGGKPGTDLVLGLVEYEEGFAWAESAGLVGQWTPGAEYCPAYGPPSGFFESPFDLVRVDRDLVAAGSSEPEGSPNHVRWLLRR